MTHEDYKALLAAKALTALDVEDARALDSHLESCADCRSEVSEWEATAALLALDATPIEPPAELRERILASVHAEGKSVEAGSDRAPYFTLAPDSKVLAFERPTKNVWASFGSLGAIAAMLLIAVLIGALVMLSQQNRVAQAKLVRLSIELEQAKAQIEHQRAIAEMFTSPDSRMAKLAGTRVAPGAHAMIAYDRNGHAMLLAGGLPAAPKGMAYQLWFIKDDKKMPGKVFTPDAAGNGTLEDQMPAVAMADTIFAITLEPEGGVSAPTGAIYLLSAA
jgi:anti-sigma-K factor RskA